ncbi:superfamily II DNA/RNA helicase [Inhella inkyongensis]|uniref:Superfamily II DNA/RNA helicase n=1 Tax=Inhella inkyongensis TaxID=392593 RepID=A0A840S511_9BURK|nr:DEAD/DEAH box helicase [Inhella inkyongensis]MBB5203904.1 superfamily II DNA/RNA helicase [Inhella inkyongensis]
MSFESLGLAEQLLAAVQEAGYTEATAVQAQAVPQGMAGADLMVSSRTGSGKTAAFLLPMLTQVLTRRAEHPELVPAPMPGRSFHAGRNQRPPRAPRGAARGPAVNPIGLVLAPTRELAQQVAQAAIQLGRNIPGFSVCTIVGGMPYQAQLQRLRLGADIVIATPGRLLDIANTSPAMLTEIKTLVLDEADRMLDLGFIEDIEAIAAMLPKPRQTLMFSATFDGRVGGLARELLNNPQRIDVASAPEQKAQIEQRLHWADHPHHRHALLEHLLADASVDQAVVFAGTQIEAEQMAGQLAELGHAVAALHGGMPQGKRNRTLQGLRRRELRVLVATDVAARGIDVPTISHVINIGLPMKAEDYVHRIGRTGRAGRSGLAVTIAMREDLPRLRRLQAYTKEALVAHRIEGLEPKKPDPVIFSERPRREFDGGERPQWGDRKPYGGDRPQWGERKPYGGDRPAFGDRKPYGGDRPQFGDRKPFAGQGRPFHEGGDRPQFGDRKPFAGQGRPFHEGGDRPQFGDRKPFGGDRPQFGDRKPFGGDRPQFGDRKPFGGDRPQFGDRKPFGGDRPQFGDRKPFGGDRPQFGDRKPFGGERPQAERAWEDRGAPRGGFGKPRRNEE